MREAAITGAVAGVLVILLIGYAPRIGAGELATLGRVLFAALIGALGGVLVRLIRR